MIRSLRQILELNLPGLVRYGSLFLHPLCVLLGRREVQIVPLLLQEVLSTLQVAIRVLPTSTWMLLQSTGSLQVLLQLFQVHCELISGERKHFSALDIPTASSSSSTKGEQKKDMNALQLEQEGNLVFHATALVLASTSANQFQQQQKQQQHGVLGKRKQYLDQDVEPANDLFTALIFETIDTLLLHTGRWLIAQPEGKVFLEQVQLAMLFPLVALQRGILPSQFQDKKMHRLYGERIRHSLSLQTSLLRTAGNVFLVTGAADHIYLPIIRDVAQMVTLQAGRGSDGTLSSEAQRIIFLTGHLVHPSVLPMPSTAPAVLASEYLAQEKKRRRVENTQREIDEAQLSGSTGADIVEATAVSATATSLFTNPVSESATSKTSQSQQPQPHLSYAATAPSTLTSTTTALTKVTATVNTTRQVQKPVAMQTDEDDDIPDIDISSDQE